ncbi:kinetochore-associated protein NSL1 homolog [Amia ocellicauda]|uniref:kinetochore-associated protein NSL1 homolog n=1 Tax=Amia ocellicauda TaxID=2972642 RepID=UPI003464D738
MALNSRDGGEFESGVTSNTNIKSTLDDMKTCRDELEVKEEDFRVECYSKTLVVEQLEKYRVILKKVLDGQPHISGEARERALQDLLWDFETAVQDNVKCNGQSWEDAPDEVIHDADSKSLDDLLDENILETAMKRSHCPKKILPYVVRSLKAEREIMGLYKQTVQSQEVKKDLQQETTMNNLMDSAPKIAKQASTTVKLLQVLLQKAEGVCQALRLQPALESSEVHREVFNKQSGLGNGLSGDLGRPLKATAPGNSVKPPGENRPLSKRPFPENVAPNMYAVTSKKLLSSVHTEDEQNEQQAPLPGS